MSILSKFRSKEKLIHAVAYLSLGFFLLEPSISAALSIIRTWGTEAPIEWWLGISVGLILGGVLLLSAYAVWNTRPYYWLISGVAYVGLASVFFRDAVLSYLYIISAEAALTDWLSIGLSLIIGISFLLLGAANLFENREK